MSRLGAAAFCAAALLLASGCAQRTYVVFPPEKPKVEPPAMCIVDLRGLEIGQSTIAMVRDWYEATRQKQPECRDLRLTFSPRDHRGVTEDDRYPDHFIVVQLALDSDPERLPLKDGPVVRASFCNPAPVDINPCVERVPIKDEDTPVVADDPGPVVDRPPPEKKIGDPPPPIFLPPVICTPASGTPCLIKGDEGEDEGGDEGADDGSDDTARSAGKKGAAGVGEGLQEKLTPAFVGGAIVYALAFLNMLPFAGQAKAAGVRRQLPDLGSEEEADPVPPAMGGGSEASPTDPRVGFEPGHFEAAQLDEGDRGPERP